MGSKAKAFLALLIPPLTLILVASPFQSAHAQSQSVISIQDTYLKNGQANKNQGSETILRVRSSGNNRALVQFDQAEIANAVGSGTLTSARLRLHIVFNGNNWGSTGRGVAAHRMTQPWSELGATWNCPDDTNTGNPSPDCVQWVMNDSSQWPFAAAPTDVVLHQNGQSGAVEWDVTDDVAAMLAGTAPNHGWLVKKVDEGQSGRADYSSREGTLPPELVITVDGPVAPPTATVQDTYILSGQRNQNKGSEVILRVRSSGNNRALVRFDQAEIAAQVGSGTLNSAKLRLTIVFNGNNWGTTGRDVAVHRMTQTWSEIGATWNCPNDANTENSAPDCAQWEMNNSSLWPFDAVPADVALHQNGQSGTVEWDVTADVAAFLAGTVPNHGWIVKKVEEGQSGHVEYSSREGVAPPELVLDVSEGAAGPVVSIASPANLSLFNSSPIVVSGTINDPSASVVVNGVSASIGAGTFTAAGVPLKEGSNLIAATATDSFGTTGTSSITATLDTTPPTVLIDSPSNGSALSQPIVTVSGMINDIVTGTVNGNDAVVTVNGIDAQVSNRSFIVADLPLRRGPNTITAIATDKAGNTNSNSISVTFQQLAGQKINLISGDNQTAIIGTTLLFPLVVALTDSAGNPFPGRAVTFKVTRGDGSVSGASQQGRSIDVVTDTAGRAQVLFTLGTRAGAGSQRITATAVGFVGEVVFSASALPAAATSIKTISGENQRGVAEQPLPQPFVVFVHDAGGNPVQGVPVTFQVLDGGGNFGGQPFAVRNTDSDGRAAAVLTLGPQVGINNNVVNATFPGLTGLPAVFTASGLASGDPADTIVSGVVLDNSNNPIPGVTAKILGTNLQAVTDSQGQFTIPGAPVGAITLEVDGTTTTRPGLWPVLDFDLTTISGQDNTIGMPIFLLPLDTVNAKVVGGPQDVTLQMANVPGLTLTVFANSVTCPDGSSQCQVMITQVHRDKVPMPPPAGAAPRLVWTIQPAGIFFDPPARITYPNVDGLLPGQVIDIFSFDHDLGEFVSIGTGTVSEDGSVITSDPGAGIRKAGWGFARAQLPPTTESESDTCETAANDTAEQALEFASTNPDAVPFTNIQACIARSVCERAKPGGEDFADNTWAKTIVPRFVNRFLDGVEDPNSPWQIILEACKGQIGSTACADLMAEQHIEKDLLDALLSMDQLKKEGFVQQACGTPSDWNQVFDDVKTCISAEPSLDPLAKIFAPFIIGNRRQDIRNNCQNALGERDG